MASYTGCVCSRGLFSSPKALKAFHLHSLCRRKLLLAHQTASLPSRAARQRAAGQVFHDSRFPNSSHACYRAAVSSLKPLQLSNTRTKPFLWFPSRFSAGFAHSLGSEKPAPPAGTQGRCTASKDPAPSCSPSEGLGREGQASYKRAFKDLIKGWACAGSVCKRCGYLQLIFSVSALQRARTPWLTDPMWSRAAELPGTLQPSSRQRQL